MDFVRSNFGTNKPLPVEHFFPHFLASLLCVRTEFTSYKIHILTEVDIKTQNVFRSINGNKNKICVLLLSSHTTQDGGSRWTQLRQWCLITILQSNRIFWKIELCSASTAPFFLSDYEVRLLQMANCTMV